MHRVLWLICALGLAHKVARAQEATFPPDPAALFGPAVEFIDMRLKSTLVENANPIYPSREFNAIITTSGDVFPYPDDLTALSSYNGVVRVIVAGDTAYLDPNGIDAGEFAYWSLDLSTGAYTRLSQLPGAVETLCGNVPLAHIAVWVFIDGTACHLSDGLRTPPLPEGYTNWEVVPNRNSPDTLILLADSSGTSTLFGVKEASFYALGEVQRNQRATLTRLHNDFAFLLKIDDGFEGSPVAYLVDVDAMRLRDLPANIYFQTDPPRLEQLENGETRQSVVAYDLLSAIEVNYIFDPACNPDFAAYPFYYCRVLDADAAQATVTRVDVMAGDVRALYTGEVEDIRWVSDDGRYMLLLLDNSGRVETGITNAEQYDPQAAGQPQMVLVDVERGETIYTTPATRGGFFESWQPSLYIINDEWVSLWDNISAEATLLHINASDVQVRRVAGTPSPDLGNGWAYLFPLRRENEYGAIADLSLYQLATGQELALVSIAGVPDAYIDDFVYLGGGQFEITIGYIGDTPRLENLAVYHVGVAGVED
jgi:hypothetical protein